MKKMWLFGLAVLVIFSGSGRAMSAEVNFPTKPIEFVIPAGTGGGADQMARLLQGIITKNNLMKQPLIVVIKSLDKTGRSKILL